MRSTPPHLYTLRNSPACVRQGNCDSTPYQQWRASQTAMDASHTVKSCSLIACPTFLLDEFISGCRSGLKANLFVQLKALPLPLDIGFVQVVAAHLILVLHEQLPIGHAGCVLNVLEMLHPLQFFNNLGRLYAGLTVRSEFVRC